MKRVLLTFDKSKMSKEEIHNLNLAHSKFIKADLGLDIVYTKERIVWGIYLDEEKLINIEIKGE